MDRADCAGRTLAALYDAGKLADPQLAPESALGRRQAPERCRAAAEYLAMHFAAAVAGAGGLTRARFGRERNPQTSYLPFQIVERCAIEPHTSNS